MKAFRLMLVLALLLGAFGVSQAAQAGAFTYTSGFQVQNLEGAQANITVYFYNQDGSLNNSVGQAIPANSSYTFFPLTQVSDNFNGSVVISSDKQVAAISNVLGNGGLAAASYVASSAGNNTVLIPLLMKNNSGYNTWFNVQNTGTSDASVTVAYSDGTNVGPRTVKAGASQTFDQATETHSLAAFSGVVTSNVPVAVTVIEESSKIIFAYSGFNAGAVMPVFPLIQTNNAGYQTGIQIQNGGSAATDVTVSYTPAGAGTACTEKQTIPAGQSKTFALLPFAGVANPGIVTNCAGGVKFVGAAQVSINTANQPLVAIVNQLKGSVVGGAYDAFDPSTATSKVVLPLIMDRNGGYFTGITVQNVGAAAATITCTFTNTSYTASATVQPGAALVDLQFGKIAQTYVGSATCTAPGGQIVGIVNELGPSSTADQLLVYEGINAP